MQIGGARLACAAGLLPQALGTPRLVSNAVAPWLAWHSFAVLASPAFIHNLC